MRVVSLLLLLLLASASVGCAVGPDEEEGGWSEATDETYEPDGTGPDAGGEGEVWPSARVDPPGCRENLRCDRTRDCGCPFTGCFAFGTPDPVYLCCKRVLYRLIRGSCNPICWRYGEGVPPPGTPCDPLAFRDAGPPDRDARAR